MLDKLTDKTKGSSFQPETDGRMINGGCRLPQQLPAGHGGTDGVDAEAGRAALRCCPASSHIAAQRALVETAPARNVPHSLYDAVAYRDVLVPPIDSAVLHTGQEDEPVPCGQRHRAFRDWIDRRPTSLAGPDYDATISFGLPFEPEDSQYGKYGTASVEEKVCR